MIEYNDGNQIIFSLFFCLFLLVNKVELAILNCLGLLWSRLVLYWKWVCLMVSGYPG